MILPDIVDLAALKHPHRSALIAGRVELSFANLRARVAAVARAVAGITDVGDRVAVLAQNIPEYVELLYGVPAAGRVICPLNYRLHGSELAQILGNASARVLIAQRDYLDTAEQLKRSVPSIEHLIVVGETPQDHDWSYEAFLADGVTETPGSPAEDEIAWLIYTSGTTGVPKGVMLSHRALTMGAVGVLVENGIDPSERNLFAMPLCHAVAMSVLVTHLQAGTLVLANRFDPEPFLQLIQEHAITSTTLAPIMLNALFNEHSIDEYDLSSLRSIAYGGAPMPPALMKRVCDRFGPILWGALGMTEAVGPIAILPKMVGQRAVNGEPHLLESVGQASALVGVRIVDESMRDCEIGEIGEIVVRGDLLMSGYWKSPELTDAAFRGGWFHTGDMARTDKEGFFYLVDRKKDMIITGGENVYSAEVEHAVHEHPGVEEAAVVGLSDAAWGERVVAVVVRRPGSNVTEIEIQQACRDRLAGYKIPRQVVFVSSLPRNVSGKVLKNQLRDELSRHQNPAIEGAR